MSLEGRDGLVETAGPTETKMKMTADAAEVSGIRLRDALGKAWGQ